MSELIQKHDHDTIRWKLLTGASTLVLITYVSIGHPAKADDSDRPTAWINWAGS